MDAGPQVWAKPEFVPPAQHRWEASQLWLIWELSGDTPDAELLRSAYRALHHPLGNRAFAEGALAMREPQESGSVGH